MLTCLYVEALLADEELADQVWGHGIGGRLMIRQRGWGGGGLPIAPVVAVRIRELITYLVLLYTAQQRQVNSDGAR